MNQQTTTQATHQQQYNLFALSKGTAHSGWSCEKEDELGRALTLRKTSMPVSAH